MTQIDLNQVFVSNKNEVKKIPQKSIDYWGISN